jgi:eukaryotic-like serine/threonine-protein kinase
VTDPHVLGSYRLIAELGRGGMADVFLAATEGPSGSGFTKLAVVKTLRPHLAEDPEFVAMLMDEARITARLAHPNVVQLFEVGRVEGQYFLAMEFLEGQALHRIVQRAAYRRTEVPPEVYYALVSDVLAGLHHAHELTDYDGTPFEVTHRDVTPHNVFVTYAGAVKVVDFGIAKATGRTSQTEHGTVKGKVRYMSPEQAGGGLVDRRTDIFAAGLILSNLVTRTTFWGERTDVEVSQALQHGDYGSSPRERCPSVPLEIDAICRKALAFRREDRYATADEMRADLEAVLGRGSLSARRKLASIMEEFFEDDRAKLRAVLETSSLASIASVDALTMTLGIAPRAEPSSTREPTSVAPVAVSSRIAPAPAPSMAPARRARTGARLARAVAVATVVAGLAAAAFLGRDMLSSRPPAIATATPAVVVSDLTTSSRDVRSRAEPATAATITKKSIAARHGLASAAERAHLDAAPAEAALSPAPPPVSPNEGAKAEHKRALDAADPWAPVSTRTGN